MNKSLILFGSQQKHIRLDLTKGYKLNYKILRRYLEAKLSSKSELLSDQIYFKNSYDDFGMHKKCTEIKKEEIIKRKKISYKMI